MGRNSLKNGQVVFLFFEMPHPEGTMGRNSLKNGQVVFLFFEMPHPEGTITDRHFFPLG
jgi:hypothetical protein